MWQLAGKRENVNNVTNLNNENCIKPLIFEKRDNIKSKINRDNEVILYSLPKILSISDPRLKIFNLENEKEKNSLKREFENEDDINIKFYNEENFIEEILCKNNKVSEWKYSIGIWEKEESYIWDYTDEYTEMEGWLIHNLTRFKCGIIMKNII